MTEINTVILTLLQATITKVTHQGLTTDLMVSKATITAVVEVATITMGSRREVVVKVEDVVDLPEGVQEEVGNTGLT